MTEHAVRPESVEGFPHTNERARIVRDRDQLRVVERRYYWDTEKRRGMEKRKYIGYVVDGVYYSNAEYRKTFTRSGAKRAAAQREPAPPVMDAHPMDVAVPALKMRPAAEFPLYYAIARDTGLLEDLTSAWGERGARIILSVAFHWMHTGNNAISLYASWSPGRLLPYTGNISSRELSEFLDDLTQLSGCRECFFGARLARLPEDEVLLSFDVSGIASAAGDMDCVRDGGERSAYWQRRVGLIVLLGRRSQMPVLFRVLPGRITDVTAVPDMLFHFDEPADSVRVFAAVVDRCSLEDIGCFIDAQNRVVLPADGTMPCVAEAMEAAMPALGDAKHYIYEKRCWGCTIPMEQLFSDGKQRRFWVHVYRSDMLLHHETAQFAQAIMRFEQKWSSCRPETNTGEAYEEQALRRSPLLKYYVDPGRPGVDALVRNNTAIQEDMGRCGLFCSITTFECTAAEAFIDGATRDCMARSFTPGRPDAGMEVPGSHGAESSEGRLVIGFCCMTILSRICQLMHQSVTVESPEGRRQEFPPLIDEMTFDELRNHLSSVCMLDDGRGGRRWGAVSQEQHLIALRMGYPDLYRTLPDWGIR